MFLNKIDLPNCLVVFFVVCPRKPAENASKRPRRGQTKQRLQQGNKVKSNKNITFFLSFKKNRLHCTSHKSPFK